MTERKGLSRRAVAAGVTGPGNAAAASRGPYATHGSGRAASVSYEPVPVGRGGGPSGTDRVHVLKVGPREARTVLVLVPGGFGAAGDFRLLARDLVEAVPEVQVWAFDRREENLVDRAGFDAPDPAAYYLDGRYRSQDPAASRYVAGWGLGVAVEDLRAVVRTARQGGRRRVVLGGHSWGATTALAYAAWDFRGDPGCRDLAGLALIDGGVLGAFGGGRPNSPEDVRKRLAAIDGGAVFDMSMAAVKLGDRAESTQIWYQLAGWYAHTDPEGRSVLQPRLPDFLRTPYPITNAALLGTLVDQGFGWPNDISVHSGHLAGTGDVRDWVDDGITPISRVAAAYAGPRPTVWEWYWPARLSLDLDVTDSYTDNELARSLGLALRHTAELNVPLYAFETSAYGGAALAAAREVVAGSRIPYGVYDSDESMNHLDPLFATTAHNSATRTLAAFLTRFRGE
ncbi:alpha/beta hydrolase [Streptomyces spongiae]|uniref:Alpha/beta hydrolase n=1 Tax=Streptomyces spongiae TaxID=565072 RepID=A0A5N8X8T1_9ACTN|nr:alpha/beta hydrolase [Streptomyces spongiae]MPY55901.1 alpha/beta hydrolase [Streptomyces spongiae]